MLEIHLLGPPRIHRDGESVTNLRSDKVRALLAYLAVEAGQPHRREKLAGLLWPDYPESSARASLRRALADLRKGIGDESAEPPYLLIDRQTIQFNRDSQALVDVSKFASLSQTTEQTNGGLESWVNAVDLYQGEFMEGFSLPDSPPFEEWQLFTREHHHRQVLDTLHQLSEALEADGEYESALPYAWRQVEIEPTKENGHRQIMRLLAQSGHREAALAQYEACRTVLARELGVEPAHETQVLYQQLLSGEWPKSTPIDTLESAAQTRTIGASPYRGLSAFREEDAPYFFGREEFTSELLSEIEKPPAMAVILGPSGSGKSSVAYAGLLPRLRDKGDWLIAHFRPGARPFYALAAALLPLLERDLSETDHLIESQKLADALSGRSLSLNQLFERILEVDQDGNRLLLLVDQFEELYTLCPVQETRQAFIDELLSAFERNHGTRKFPHSVLVTMRADFMGQALAYRPFADTLQQATLMLGPMTHAEMHAAIESPAEVGGAAFEGGLVERILDGVGDEPGNLPLMQFALTLLWDSGWLTHESYERVGHVEGALAKYADQVYEELDDGEQEAARQIFVQLVRPGEGTEDTRRTASRSEIGEENWLLTQYLADKRLVVTGRSIEGDETVELVHETLIRNWGQYGEWIDEDRAFRTWQESLRDSIRQWESTDRNKGAHLRGIPLSEAEIWSAERGAELSAAELEFIQASLDSRDRRQAERERLRRRITIGLAAGLMITLLLAIFAGLQWQQADQQRSAALQAQATAAVERDQTQSALAGLLAAQAANLLEEQYDLALLLGLESVQRVDTLEGRGSLLTALQHNPSLSHFLHGHQNTVRSVAFHPDGEMIASADKDGQILLWDAETRLPLGETLSNHQEHVNSLSFHPDGSILSSASFDDTVILWDVDQNSATFGQSLGSPLNAHSGNVWSVAFSPDGETFASAGIEGEIFLWEISDSPDTSAQMIADLSGEHKGIVASLSFSPDGKILASGGADGMITLWDMETGEPLELILDDEADFITSLAFNPDGRTLAAGSKDNLIRLWDVDLDSDSFGNLVRQPLDEHNDAVWSLAFDPAGDRLVSSSEDGTVIQWNADRNSPSFGIALDPYLTGHNGGVFAIAISPDGSKLVSGAADHKLIIWDTAQRDPLTRVIRNPTDNFFSLAFKPDGESLVISSGGPGSSWRGAVYVVDLDGPLPLNYESFDQTLIGHSNWVKGLAFSPDGKILASGSDDYTIILWDMDPASETYGQPILPPLKDHTYYVLSLAFSPNGKTMYSGSKDGSILIWDVESVEVVGSIEKDEDWEVSDIHLSPDGKVLASSSFDGAIQIWDVDRDSATFGQEIGSPAGGHYGPGTGINIGARPEIRYSPDGKLLASAGPDGTIRLWDAEPGSATYAQQIGSPLIEYVTNVAALAFTPDGKYLVSGNHLGEIVLWDVNTHHGIEVSIQGESGTLFGVFDAAFSPDGNILAILLDAGTVYLLDFSIESWRSHACSRANRNLTQEEWQRFFGDEPYHPTCPDLPPGTTE